MPLQPIQLLLILSVLPIQPIHSQQNYKKRLMDPTHCWEVALTIGGNNFMGDLGGNKGKGKPLLKDYRFNNNKLLTGIATNYYLTNYAQLQVSLHFAQISDADSLIKNTGDFERWRFYRNLSFRSNVFEGYGGITFYPLLYLQRNNPEWHRANPFIGVGFGIFHFNPEAYYSGKWVKLQPLKLEGQGFAEYPDRKPYKLWQPFLPVTLGIKSTINNNWSLSAGVIMRKTFTDYLDDISTTYIEPELFDKYHSPEMAAIAKDLYSRSITPWKVKPGIKKANAENTDSYITFFLTICFRFEKYIPFYYPKM